MACLPPTEVGGMGGSAEADREAEADRALTPTACCLAELPRSAAFFG